MKVGDEVYLSPKSAYADGAEFNPLGIKGKITSVAGRIYVYWETGRTNSYDDEDLILVSRIEPKCHPNASMLMEIAKEAAVNPEPWDEFEYKAHDGSWQQMTRKCTMNCFDEIRRKPRTICIGNYDVPEPMRYEPKKGDVYYLVAPIDHAVKRYEWEGDSKEFKWLDCGFMQETREGAELMLKALQELLGKK